MLAGLDDEAVVWAANEDAPQQGPKLGGLGYWHAAKANVHGGFTGSCAEEFFKLAW